MEESLEHQGKLEQFIQAVEVPQGNSTTDSLNPKPTVDDIINLGALLRSQKFYAKDLNSVINGPKFKKDERLIINVVIAGMTTVNQIFHSMLSDFPDKEPDNNKAICVSRPIMHGTIRASTSKTFKAESQNGYQNQT